MKLIMCVSLTTILILMTQVRGYLDRDGIKKTYEKCMSPGYLKSGEDITEDCKAVLMVAYIIGDATQKKVEKYRLLVTVTTNEYTKCRQSERSELDCSLEKIEGERKTNQIKLELYPWVDSYDICDPHRSRIDCEAIIKRYQYPDRWDEKPETFIDEMKLLVEVATCKKCKGLPEEGQILFFSKHSKQEL